MPPILITKRLKILEPLQEADADEILVRNSETKEVSSLPKESVFASDNIKTEIAIDAPVDPTAEGFADAINALPLFTIDGKTIPTFKAVTTGENPVVYYVELLNLGKGSYGVTGTQLTIANLKITTVEPTSKDIAELSSTQIIDLGNQGDDVVTAMNRQMPNITIQDQNDGYTIVKGIFLNGQFHEYLWIGTAGTYGRDVLQTTDQDFKELSSVSQGVARATNAYSGTVKTDVYKENPTVYVAETVDSLLEGKANTFTEIKTITGIAYTPILSDTTKELLYEGTLPMNITIPNNSTEPFPAGTSFYTLGTNTGIVSASAAAGVTLKYKAGMLLSAVQNEIRKYTKQGVNTWLVDGSVAVTGALVYKTYFVNTVDGNNATGIYQDSAHPYATIDYVLSLPAFKSGDVIFLQNSGTFPLNGTFQASKNLTIRSDVQPILSFSGNNNTDLMPNGFIVIIDIPFGSIVNERSGGVGAYFYASGFSSHLYINALSIYWNTSNTAFRTTYLTFNVKDVSVRTTLVVASFGGVKDTNTKGIVIEKFTCLADYATFAQNLDSRVSINISHITGTGCFYFTGGRYSIGNITTTNPCVIGASYNNVFINFINSYISTLNGIDIAGDILFNATITGNILYASKITGGRSYRDATNIKYLNFSADLGAGTITLDRGTYSFENCSIKSNNSPITLTGGGAYNLALILKSSVFEVVNAVPLVAGGAGSGDTIKIAGISTNATMISDQSGTGVTVTQFTNY